MNTLPESYRSGFVAVVGRPSVGKSTLINSLLKQKIASVSPKPQTTRRKQLGIYTDDTAQVIFIDTPGIHQPVHRLGEYLNQIARDTLQDADLILWLVDISVVPQDEDGLVASYLQSVQPLPQVMLVLNKVDQARPAIPDGRKEQYLQLFPAATPIVLSALSPQSTRELLGRVIERLPEGVQYYDPDQVTDLYEREIAADLIREAVLKQIQDEVPHAVAVRIDEYEDEGESLARIHATLLVERDSQKGILIGQGGKMIKEIGILARGEIEKMTERKVYLELQVKVAKNWRNNPAALRVLGYIPQSRQEE